MLRAAAAALPASQLESAPVSGLDRACKGLENPASRVSNEDLGTGVSTVLDAAGGLANDGRLRDGRVVNLEAFRLGKLRVVPANLETTTMGDLPTARADVLPAAQRGSAQRRDRKKTRIGVATENTHCFFIPPV